jgi:fermentation-respiration switch protein FrsA (DUF1100 family)
MTTRRRRVMRRVGVALAGLLVVTAAALMYLMRDPRPRFADRRGQLKDAEVIAGAADSLHQVDLVQLRSTSGLAVELAIKRPRRTTPGGVDSLRRPLVILLGGHRTGRNAVNLIEDTRGTVVAALSYPFDGNHRVKGLAIVAEVPAIRRAILDTPSAVLLALDYLASQPFVDPARIEAVGVSLGAPFVTIAAALDERIRRVWIVHGTGGVYTPLEFNLRRQLGSRAASVPIAALAAVLISGPRLAPERWIPLIAPRPVVMINATDDARLPRASIESLYRAAGEPRERVWVTGGHVRSEAEAVRPLVALVLDRMLSAPLEVSSSNTR